jgi:hypothetical protein
MMWLRWIAMMAVSVFEYGYGAAADTLQSHNDWSQSQAFRLVTIWASSSRWSPSRPAAFVRRT